MSIVTKAGDSGTTGLMYNRRVPKDHPRVEACGAVDELNAALGMARAASRDKGLNEKLLGIQRALVTIMGDLGVASADRQRYVRDGFPLVSPELTGTFDRWVQDIEEKGISFEGWAMPGGNPVSAPLDLARTVCRRAERRVSTLKEAGELENGEVLVALNRLSDLLWLLARRSDTDSAK